jgi:hypothetical protein
MSRQTILQDRHQFLEKRLQESLQERDHVEMSIRRQIDELKRLEASLEKMGPNYGSRQNIPATQEWIGKQHRDE